MKNQPTVEPRERRAVLDSQYAKLSKVDNPVPHVDEFRTLIENMLTLADNGSAKVSKLEPRVKEAQEQIERTEKLAHEMRLMRNTLKGYRSKDQLDFSKMTDDEIDAIEPTEEVKTFARILSAFPEIYESFMERLNISREEYQNEQIQGANFIDRDRTRIAEGRTPINPTTAPLYFYEKDERGKLNYQQHPVKTIADVMQFIAKTRGEFSDGNPIKWNQETLQFVLRVIKNPDCKDYYPEEVALARTLEVLNFSDNEILELFKHVVQKSTYSFGEPKLPQGIDTEKSTQEPHIILERMVAEGREAEATRYKTHLIEFISSFRRGETKNWVFDSIIADFFSERRATELNHNLESMLTDRQKKDIMNEILQETGFSENEIADCLKANVIAD